ncbi:hypothetical protein A9Q92_03485 [Methylophaga sp. 42_8_T64]|nr:hypothetical protein A9Q92_03485 [Methylophaga sp. 42_8_T64]
MTKQNKHKYHHGDLRTQLIAAVVDMINQQSVESITMRGLSDWIGVSRTAAYRHFEDKADLLTAAAIEGFEAFTVTLKTTRIDESFDEIDRFKNMGQAYIKFAIEHPAYYRLMFGNVVIQKSEALLTTADAAFSELALMLEILQDAELIQNEDLRLQATYIWSLMHGLVSLIIDNKLNETGDTEEIVQFFQQKIMKSLSNE